MEHLTGLGAQAAALAVAVAAVLYLAKLARTAFRWLEAIHGVVDKELTHNHGSSIKDDTHGMAVALGEVQRRVDELETDFRQHLADSLAAQTEATRHATDGLTQAATQGKRHRAW